MQDDGAKSAPFIIGDGPNCQAAAQLPAGAFLTFTRDEACSFTFGLGSPDAVTLSAPDGTVVDTVKWAVGRIPDGSTLVRLPDGGAQFQLGKPTPGAPNTGVTAVRF